MKQWFLCSLAPTVALTGLLAAPATASGGDDWSSLDRDLEALVTGQDSAWTGVPNVHGLIRPSAILLPNTNSHQDDRGFKVLNAQLSVDGEVTEKVRYIVQLEAADDTARLLDAYGAWDSCKYVRVTVGRFRSPLLWESQLADSALLFILRTDTGELFYTRDEGAMLSGSVGALNWAAAVQSGLDAMADRPLISARVGFDALGGGSGLNQGAYGAGDETKLSIGAGYFDDQSQGGGKDGDVFAADAQLKVGRFAADAMVAKFQEFSSTTLGFDTRSDSLPWNVSASFMIAEDKVEAAARYQVINNINNQKDVTAGLNYYVNGHAMKFQANASYIFSDDNLIDDTVRFGLAASVSI